MNDPMDKNAPYSNPGDSSMSDRTLVGKSMGEPTPMGSTVTAPAATGTNGGMATPLLNQGEADNFRSRWTEIQSRFVDEPRTAVQQADALVTEVVQRITQVFSSEHSTLEGQWNKGNDVSTEDLRKALQHYRSFFNRLVV